MSAPPLDARDDAALVCEARRGSRDAFGALVSRYAPRILGLTRRMLGPTSDAEDAAQETFVAAWQALTRFRADARFSTWLYRIAVNKCQDARRLRQPNVMSFDRSRDDAGPGWEPIDPDTPYGVLEQGELGGTLDARIQELPPLYREAFLLRHVEGLDYAEMSEVLGVNRDTLKMRVYKARTALCRSLAHLAAAVR